LSALLGQEKSVMPCLYVERDICFGPSLKLKTLSIKPIYAMDQKKATAPYGVTGRELCPFLKKHPHYQRPRSEKQKNKKGFWKKGEDRLWSLFGSFSISDQKRVKGRASRSVREVVKGDFYSP